MLHSAQSDLGLHCLPITCLGVSRLQGLREGFVPLGSKLFPLRVDSLREGKQINSDQSDLSWWFIHSTKHHLPVFGTGLHRPVGSPSDCRFKDYKFESQLSEITFMDIDHEMISRVILPLLLIQDVQLSFTGESMSTNYWLAA